MQVYSSSVKSGKETSVYTFVLFMAEGKYDTMSCTSTEQDKVLGLMWSLKWFFSCMKKTCFVFRTFYTKFHMLRLLLVINLHIKH